MTYAAPSPRTLTADEIERYREDGVLMVKLTNTLAAARLMLTSQPLLGQLLGSRTTDNSRSVAP